MKNFCLLFALLLVSSIFSQSLPINFEGDISTSDFVDFDGGTGTVVANPIPSGINTSGSVGRIVRDGGAIFAGSKIVLTDNLDFSSLTKISMKVYTTAPIGTIVKFKLEGSGPAVDVDAATTLSGAWETLEWIFVGTPNNLNEVVFMFDFGNVGDGSSNSTFYFDDVEQVSGPAAPIPATLPLDFETGILNTDFLNYSGATASIISNPQIDANNSSATVCQIVRDGGEFWAGSKIFLQNTMDLSTLWELSANVFTTAPVGTRIKLELESSTGERTNLDYVTTTSGSWETASWNFYGQANIYDRLHFMFDFGIVGDGTSSSTFLFDDVQQSVGSVIPDPVPTSFPVDFETSVVTSDFTNFSGGIATVIPNPHITTENSSATVGKFVRSGGAPWAQSKLPLTDFIMNMSANGTISMKVYTDAPVGTLLKFKVERNVDNFADERDAYTTVSGDWATYTWDFTNQDTPIYNVLTFMLGYATPNDASSNATFLFDDIEQLPSTLSNSNSALELVGINAFPNPTTDVLNINSKNKQIQTVIVFNLLGSQVLVLHPKELSTTIDVSHLESGIYFARIVTDSGMGSLKFVVE